MPGRTRRTFLKIAGASITAAAVPTAGLTAAADGWTTAETPVDGTLHGVAHTTTNAHAVGDSGVVIERTDTGWETVLRGGPTGNGNDLYGADVTDDGERLWTVGASGAIGEYDVTTGNLVDRSAPNDYTNNFNDVAVTGPAGEADVYVADDSGSIHYSFANGEEGTWEYEVPGSGAGLPAIDFYGSRSGHAIDTNGKVFATDDGVTYEAIGIEDADVTFYGLDSDAADDVTVSGGNAAVFEYNGSQWTPESLGDADLVDIETTGGEGYAVGGGGVVFELVDGVWAATDTPTGENLNAVASGAVDLVVGSSGTVLER
ncbi:MAG: hypothetical protein ACI8UR_001099 [Natronomonas sp.]|jgi:hypothetical protein|uniref:hypothetical protein n=1 Tax=Natronomonas sp. TaxID=2184060 RepID=UPI003988A872